MSTTAARCFWDKGELVIELGGKVIRLDGPRGVQALKENSVAFAGPAGTETAAIFSWDDTRRMALIQERISLMRD